MAEYKSKARQNAEKLYEIEREQLLRKGRNNFFNFCQILSPDFYKPDRWHLWLLANTLQALYERHLTKKYFYALCTSPNIPKWLAEDVIDWDRLRDDHVYTKLMINLAPRSGKSRTLVNFCDWILGKSLENHIITVSYNTDLASNMSRYVRDGIMTQKNRPTDIVYSDIFPNTKVAKGNSSFMRWALEGAFFSYLGTGLEGTITGLGANCLLEGTLITTNKGDVPIEQVCANKDNFKVLSFDIKSGKIVYKRILATQEVCTNEIIRFTTNNNRQIACSKDHRFFDGRWFRKAETFRTGDYFYAITEQEEQKMCNLWEKQGGQGADVPRVLHDVTKIANKAKMYTLWKRFSKTDGYLSQSIKEQYHRENVLFNGMCESSTTKPIKKNNLHCLWSKATHRKDVLFSNLQGEMGKWEQTEIIGQNMSDVWENIQTYNPLNKILWEGLCRQGTFSKNDRKRKLKIQRRSKLQQAIYRIEKNCVSERQFYLSNLWKNGTEKYHNVEWSTTLADKPYLSSHRSQQDKQRTGKFNNSMQHLPSKFTPSIQADKIVGITRESGSKYKLYDIQVEGTSNFFAEKILTHNCTIIDDVLKNASEAYNQKVLDDIYAWYTQTFLSRSEHSGAGSIDIINFTRWATGDLCGRILGGSMSKDWINLLIPVEHNGEIYCEGILPRKDFEDLREYMDSNIFQANYYQKPLDVEGRLFDKLKTYDRLPEGTEGCIAYCDTADEGSDYLACVIGVIKDGEGYITDVYFTQDNMEITEPEMARRLVENKVNNAKIESNNGGKGFARNVERIIWDKYHTKQVNITWFHQTENKKARILTGSTFVINHVYFPEGWDKKYPEFYSAVMGFSKEGKNKHDDGVEALVEWGKMISGDGSFNSYLEMMKRMQEGKI